MGQAQAIIIGAGIGGLGCAVALVQAGFEVRVYEASSTLREAGAGLTLWANAIKAFGLLGLKEQLCDLSVPELYGAIRSDKGKILTEFSAETLQNRYGTANLSIHRADLQNLLVEKLGPGRVHLKKRFSEFSIEGPKVVTRFHDGSEVSGDFLVGADGIHSAVYNQLFGPSKLNYAGYTAWRGVANFDPGLIPGTAGEYWGCGLRFGIVPLTRKRVYWFAARNAPEGQVRQSRNHKKELLKLFRDWDGPVASLIEATSEGAILQNDLFDRKPLSRWGRDCITLLGDAAHPMTPNLGQGACMALEDGVTLAFSLKQSPDVKTALRLYESRRLKRTARVVLLSRLLGQVGQWSNPLACNIRNRLLQILPVSIQLGQLDALLNFEISI